eukprot:m.120340 g.120340  ORF g.120340 m.120340 type:complete len:260 (+) comp52077_c0_seq7:612-1391(+)
MDKLCDALALFFTDMDTLTLLAKPKAHIGSANAATRRSICDCIVALIKHSRRSRRYLLQTLEYLLAKGHPASLEDWAPGDMDLGCMMACRKLLALYHDGIPQPSSFHESEALSVEQAQRMLESILRLSQQAENHNLATTALETFAQLLKVLPTLPAVSALSPTAITCQPTFHRIIMCLIAFCAASDASVRVSIEALTVSCIAAALSLDPALSTMKVGCLIFCSSQFICSQAHSINRCLRCDDQISRPQGSSTSVLDQLL